MEAELRGPWAGLSKLQQRSEPGQEGLPQLPQAALLRLRLLCPRSR